MPKSLDAKEILQRNVQKLSVPTKEEMWMVPTTDAPLPSVDELQHIVDMLKQVIFHGFFDERKQNPEVRSYGIGVNLEKVVSSLKKQIERAIHYKFSERNREEVKLQASEIAISFLDRIPEIKRLLFTDVLAVFENDPAVDNYGEVIFSYPVIQAMVSYRIAHELLVMGVPVIPRIITEQAHSATGIDIHPGAQIGEYFSIDHGTGVVIGETCIIGHHVTLYQGVTLGAKNFKINHEGKPQNTPRHPILEDYVTIYSNSTVLGRVTIGHHTVIGGNIWVTHSLAPYSTLIQGRAISMDFTDGAGI